MKIVVLHESMFGNTRQIAEAIARGAQDAAPGVDVVCVRVGESDPDQLRAADLLVVGGPTHIRGMSSAMTRKMGLSSEEKKAADEQHDTEPGAAGPGVRDWFDDLPKVANGAKAAAFDTRVDARMAGGAAHGIARRLRRHGYELIGEPEGFIVEDMEGPRHTGELERAKAWGADLVRRATSDVST